MIRSAFILFFYFLSLSLYCQPVAADDLLGVWLIQNENAKVKITKKAKVYSGEIVWLKNPLTETGDIKTDRLNPDSTKRGQALLGLKVLKDLVFEKDRWENGSAYDPENGKTYTLTIRKKDNGIELRGYSGQTMIGRIQSWKKTE